jgi:hypothetical protein
MKPTIIFTDFIENNEANGYSIEMLAKVNGHVEKFVSCPNSPDIDKAKKDQVFRVGLNTLLSNCMAHLRTLDQSVPSPVGMAMADKFSFFEVKQTPTFNNDLHKAARDTSIILEGIW